MLMARLFHLHFLRNVGPPCTEPLKNRFPVPPAKGKDKERVTVTLLCKQVKNRGNMLARVRRVRAAALGPDLLACGRQERQAGTGKDRLNLMGDLSSQEHGGE